MEFVLNFINEYGTTIFYAIITTLAGWIGLQVKNLATKYINDKTKKDVVLVVVKAVKQIYKELNGEEKLCKAIESATEMLAAKGITVTELELRMLIEAAYTEIAEKVEPVINPEKHVEELPENTETVILEDCSVGENSPEIKE